jgi:hypothetical protein
MRTHIVRRRLAHGAVVAASAALLAACGQHPGANPTDTGNGSIGQAPGYKVGLALISDGTNVVRVGDQKVIFPTTVADAVFSADGSRIAFVNGDGNIATARPDGKGLKVLTAKAAGVVRSRPTWSGTGVVFTERAGNGAAILKSVASNTAGTFYNEPGEQDADMGVDGDNGGGDKQVGSNASAVATGPGREAAFQRAGSKGPEVWVSDQNQREPYQSKLIDGSEPALSSDGMRVAFVGPAGQVEVVDAVKEKAAPVQITFGATSPTHLIWTPDGRIAYSTPTGVESVAATVAAGATSNPPTSISSTPGVVTFLPAPRDKVTRIVGTDPVEVAVAASQAVWPTRDTAPLVQGVRSGAYTVLLTGTTNLPTVLAGAQMVDGGPLLLTKGSTLDTRTAAELKRVLGRVGPDVPQPTVTIVGGTDVVPTQAEAAVNAMGYLTERTTAPDPIAMAATVSGRPDLAEAVFLVDAADTPTYLSAISDLGSASQQAVLLTNGPTMPDKVKTFLNGIDASRVKVYPLDAAAQAAVASSWSGKPALKVTTLTGNVTGTLLGRFSATAAGVVVVDKSNLTDILTAIGLARTYGAPVLAVDPAAGLDDAVKAWLDASSAVVDKAFIVDSKGVLGADLERTLGGLVAGPLGATTVTNPKTTTT